MDSNSENAPFITVFHSRTGDTIPNGVTKIPLKGGKLATLKLNADACDGRRVSGVVDREASLIVTAHYQRQQDTKDTGALSPPEAPIQGGLQFALVDPRGWSQRNLDCDPSSLYVFLSPLVRWPYGILDVRLLHAYFSDYDPDAAVVRLGYARVIFVDSSCAVHYVRVNFDLRIECTDQEAQPVLHAKLVQDSSRSSPMVYPTTVDNNAIGLAFDYLVAPKLQDSPVSAAGASPTSLAETDTVRIGTVAWSTSSGNVFYLTDFQTSSTPIQLVSVPLCDESTSYLRDRVSSSPQKFDNSVRPTERWRAHDAEIWAIGLETVTSNGRVLATGADDSCLKLWDIRTISSGPCRANSKTHESGVTVVKFDPIDAFLLYTGSYDGVIRFWDSRNLSKPTQEIQTPDGIWRLEHLDAATNYAIPRSVAHSQSITSPTNRVIAVAATRGGCVLFERSSPLQASATNADLISEHTEFQVTKFGEYTAEHRSMVYGISGVGIHTVKDDIRLGLFCSVSFYDSSLCLWTQVMPT